MIENVRLKQPIHKINSTNKVENNQMTQSLGISAPSFKGIINFQNPFSKSELGVNTKLTSQKDIEMYNAITTLLSSSGTEKISPLDNVSRLQKLDALLKNGTLLNNASNDNSTTLENLYKIAISQRGNGFSNDKILGQTLDALYTPEIITQAFGDIPSHVKAEILKSPDVDDTIKQNPSLLDVAGSGTCVSASFEYHMARKHPAEFARWAEGLTSPDEAVEQTIKASSLNSSYLEAYNILMNMFDIKPEKIDFNTQDFKIKLKPDKNAKIRAQIQNNFWDRGERSILDVYIQSTFMQMGSEQTYNSLTDKREGKFNSNPEGLGEFEKIFIESIIENNERLSMVYQKVDDKQNLTGWGCDLETIQKHITQTLDAGEDVIVGYVLTNETSGDTKNPNYVNTPDNRPNKIVNGHEITIVGYKQDSSGKITFICNDTDDNYNGLIEYSADYLIPKIHHAGYPAKIVEADYDRITNEVYGINTAA